MKDEMRLLLFPIDMDECDSMLAIATTLGISCIGASSALSDAGNRPLHAFARLPYVTDPDFEKAFTALLKAQGIDRVFTPHHGVWQRLDDMQKSASPPRHPFALCGPEPFTATWLRHADHDAWAATAACSPLVEGMDDGPLHPPLSRPQYAALHRMFMATPGQSDVDKLSALCDIARMLPAGDLLEIGCLYGRSALALGFLAARHGIGNLICVDPWNLERMTDQGSGAALLDAGRPQVDFGLIFSIFRSTIAQLDNAGYIRATSAAAEPLYAAAKKNGYLDSPDLPRIALAPHLALLHIDGNHRYDQVRDDVQRWLPHLASGGWLLLDDYVWAFGDGPQRVGDELLRSGLFDRTFVNGDTLFLRKP